jgi:hypothetical protein
MKAVRLTGSRLIVILGTALWLYSDVPCMATTPSGDWTQITEERRCEALPDGVCVGRYGFAIKPDGTFSAGPAPDGSKVAGRIAPDDLRRLARLINQILAQPVRARTCERAGMPGVKDYIDITPLGASPERLYDQGSNLAETCYAGSPEHVRALQEYTRDLMIRYYPIPFPKE